MVSLMTVVIFATIITVVVTIYSGIVVKQQQEAINYDLGTRAFYAAESGFQDTIRAIDSGAVKAGDYASTANSKKTCPVVLNYAANTPNGTQPLSNNTAYTCQMINFTPNSLITSGLGENQSELFPLRPLPGATPTKVVITWKADGSQPRFNTRKALLPKSNWTAGPYPPMLRTMFFWMNNGTASRGDISNQSYFFNPVGTADTTPPFIDLNGLGGVGAGAADTNVANLPQNDPIKNASCVRLGSDTTCTTTVNINNFSAGKLLYVAIKPIYRSVDEVSVKLQDGAGNNIPFASGQAEVDITGKSGNVFRRIVQAHGYGAEQVTRIDNFPDFSIVGGSGICKMMDITAGGTDTSKCTP